MTKVNEILEKIQKFFNSNLRQAVLLLFILEFGINIWITPNQYDSAFFIEKMSEMKLFDFIGMRYQTWTSRVVIETIMCLILPHKFYWILLNTIMTTIIGYSIIKIFVKDDNKSLTWISLCFILLYPMHKVATCDWGAGTMVYTWTFAMLLLASIPVKQIYFGEKIKKFMYPIYLLALIFACNQEQVCVIAFGIYVVFIILEFLKNNKKVHPYLIVGCVFIIFSFIFILTCPGNYARKNDEIITYDNDFKMFGIFDKLSLGLTSTVNNLLVNVNVVFLAFSIICATYILRKYKNNLYRVVALIPLVSELVFGIFKNTICSLYPYFGMFYEQILKETSMLTVGNYLNPINYFPIILSFVLLGSMALNILLIFKDFYKNIAFLIYVLGVGSRVMMGFSPTVFASTDRTFIFFEFALIIISILIWQEYLKETDTKQVKVRERLGTIIVISAVLQYLHTLIYTLISQM